jgi:hypothetical protein
MDGHEWFVILKGKREGPFSVPELLRQEGVDENTLAWREGMEKWLPIREIPELKFLFIEKEPSLPSQEEVEGPQVKSEDLVLSLPNAQPPVIFWIFFITLLLTYALYQFYFNR